MIRADFILANAGELVTMAGSPVPRRGPECRELSVIRDGALACRSGTVVWTGRTSDITSNIVLLPGGEEYSAEGRLVTPGFVDSHTHPLYAGTRQTEFALRARGADYEEIAASGGGILNSVRRTRLASAFQLEETMTGHLETMLIYGTTTVEAKSGYGLDLLTEIRCLEAAVATAGRTPMTVVLTFLGAHEVPEEYRGRADDYIDFLIGDVLPVIREKQLAEYVDIFCELNVFTPEQTRRYLEAAKGMGFRLRMHADEFHDTGGAAVAVEVGADSADHLLSISDANISLIAESSTVATLLPGTAFFLGKPFPPARKLLDAGAAVAIATDLNPGSCFCESMPFMVNLAVCQCGFTIEEALTAATVNGAATLGLADRKGRLAPGTDADMIVWDMDDYRGIAYHVAVPDIREVLVGGSPVYFGGDGDLTGWNDAEQGIHE